MIDDDVEHRKPNAQQRPEELRLIEALLFAAGEPLDEKALAKRMPAGVDIKATLRKLQTEYAAARRQSRSCRQQMGVPHRERSRLAADA